METQAVDLLTTFADEAGGWFDALDAGVATLDQAPDEETVHAMFRAAHNLKGSSRAVELAEVGELAHVAEELFDRFRSGKLATSRALLSVVAAMTDALRELTAESIAVKRGAQRARAREVVAPSVQPEQIAQLVLELPVVLVHLALHPLQPV